MVITNFVTCQPRRSDLRAIANTIPRPHRTSFIAVLVSGHAIVWLFINWVRAIARRIVRSEGGSRIKFSRPECNETRLVRTARMIYFLLFFLLSFHLCFFIIFFSPPIFPTIMAPTSPFYPPTCARCVFTCIANVERKLVSRSEETCTAPPPFFFLALKVVSQDESDNFVSKSDTRLRER